MKKKLTILFAVMLISFFAVSQTTDSTFNKIYMLNFESYINKPVDSLLKSLPSGYTEIKLYGHITNNKVHFLCVSYSGGTEVYFYVKRYRYMSINDSTRLWDINKFRKENLSYVSLRNYNFNLNKAAASE